MNYTNEEIANDRNLWNQYVNASLKEAQDLLKSCDEQEAKMKAVRNELKAMVKRIDAVTKRVQAVCKEPTL